MTFKRILCLVFALCLMVSVMSACGGKKDNTSSAGNTSSKSDKIEAIDPDMTGWEDFDPYKQMPASSKGVTVRYATWIDQKADIGAYTLANVKNDIGIDVELYFIKQSGYVQEIMTKIASKDIPDVFISNEAGGAFPITLQIAAPINKVSSVELKDPRFDQIFLKNATIEGNTYYLNTIGTPLGNGNMVFYNKRLFEENGYTTPEEHYENGTWSWDTLLNCAKDIKALGDDYKGIHLELDILAGSVGTSITKYNFGTHTFSNGTQDPTLLKAYQWFAEAKENGYIDGSLGAFTNGKCGFYIRGPYGLQSKGYFMDMDFEDVGFTWLPSFNEGEKGLISSIYGAHGIVDGAPNADAAGYFIRYWLDYKNWDLENVFFSVEAGQFYYKITEATADEKYFNFDWPLAILAEYADVNSAFYSTINKTSKNDMKTVLDSMSNIVDTAVERGNQLIADKIAADRVKYGA